MLHRISQSIIVILCKFLLNNRTSRRLISVIQKSTLQKVMQIAVISQEFEYIWHVLDSINEANFNKKVGLTLHRSQVIMQHHITNKLQKLHTYQQDTKFNERGYFQEICSESDTSINICHQTDYGHSKNKLFIGKN